MQIIVSPPAGVTVWWYTPRLRSPVWYIHAIRPRRRGGEIDGVEYCVLSQLTGTSPAPSVRYCVTPYCGIPSRYIAVFASRQLVEARQYTRHIAAMAYRLAISPSGNLWWHQWSPHLDDKLEPFHAH